MCKISRKKKPYMIYGKDGYEISEVTYIRAQIRTDSADDIIAILLDYLYKQCDYTNQLVVDSKIKRLIDALDYDGCMLTRNI